MTHPKIVLVQLKQQQSISEAKQKKPICPEAGILGSDHKGASFQSSQPFSFMVYGWSYFLPPFFLLV